MDSWGIAIIDLIRYINGKAITIRYALQIIRRVAG